MRGRSESNWITSNDRERSATVSGMGDLVRALSVLDHSHVERLLDVGCGFGGLTRFVSDHVRARETHGLDIDAHALHEAATKGVTTRRVDARIEPLPYGDGLFDLIISFGMMDYLPTFDPLVREIHRVLSPGGHVLISLPNLGSWHNRLALFLGYQPRDVEISDEKVVGTIARFRDDQPTGHIHTPTLRAFVEFMEFHGFVTMRVTAGRPITRPTHSVLRWIDWAFSQRVSLARRFFYLGRKST